MRITKQICNAIESLLRDKDYSETQLADKLGVAQRTVNSWKRGEVGSIKDCYWEQLEPMLRPYLNESPPTTAKVVSNAEFVTGPLPLYPVISMAAAAEAAGSIYLPIDEYATMYADEYVPFSQGRKGDFVIKVAGNSMMPWYPPGTCLLVRPFQRVKNGDRVVAVMTNGDILFKCFVELEDTILLLSVNEDDGCKIEVPKTDRCTIRALYKVIQSIRTEADLDEAMKENGKGHFWEKYLIKKEVKK